MQQPILTSKLFIPRPRPEAINRSRLLGKIDKGLSGKFTLISAPAGFGKSTLVSQWNQQTPIKIAWLSLDEKDNDLIRFLSYLIASLQTVHPEIGKGVFNLMLSGQLPVIENLLTPLLNEIAEVEERFVLVLDDYHVIDSQPIDEVLQFILEHLPHSIHLIICTRQDPSLPLAKMRAQGQLAEIRAADLRFTTSEAAEFLESISGLSLKPEEIEALESRTEGWIAGLQLAAIYMQGQSNVADFVQSFTGSHHFIMDYLVEEVLQKQPADVHEFLLATSVLDRLCSGLCAAVLNIEEEATAAILYKLDQANLFIIPLDNERHWYRYHHLFSELLRKKLQQQSKTPSASFKNTNELHFRASIWYEENGFLVEAIHHAIFSENINRAADLIEKIWPEMERSFLASSWLGLIEKIPEKGIENRPVLCANFGSALIMKGEFEQGEIWLKKAEKWIEDISLNANQDFIIADEEQYNLLPASIADARVYLAQSLDDDESVIKYAKMALDLLPEDDYVRRGIATGLLGCTYWANGNLELAYKAFLDVKAGHHKAGNYHFEFAIALGLGGIKVTQGFLNETIRFYTHIIQDALDPKYDAKAVASDLYLELSQLYLEKGELNNAVDAHQKSKMLADQAALSDWYYRWLVAQARILEVKGELNEAVDCFIKAEHHYLKTPRPYLRPINALKVRIFLKQGHLKNAIEWVKNNSFDQNDDPVYLQEFNYLTYAKVLLACFQEKTGEQIIEQLPKLLNRLFDRAIREGRHGSVLEILIVQAMMFHVKGEIRPALDSLTKALEMAESQGYVKVFVDEGANMIHLLSELKNQKKSASYIDRLLSGFKRIDPNENQTTESNNQGLVEPLSKRELEVLSLISEGLSNKEIGERLFLSLSTIKGHNQNIFAKLQVQRRTEAIIRAKEIGLIQ